MLYAAHLSLFTALCLAHTQTHTHTHTHTAQTKPPSVGEDGFLLEPHTLSVVLKYLPKEVRGAGSRKQTVVHTCFDVSEQYLAMGSEQGYVWILDLHATKLVRELTVSIIVSQVMYLHKPIHLHTYRRHTCMYMCMYMYERKHSGVTCTM